MNLTSLNSKMLPCFLFLLASLPFSLNLQSTESETRVLLKLKQQWGTSPSIQSWDIAVPHCEWPGIECTANSVTSISLQEQNISSRIPAAICDLINLASLNLSSNFIPGGFPTVLYDCCKLQILDLSVNNFQGLLPNDIHKLSSLQHLNISVNNFSGDIPSAIGQLSRLTTLSFFNNSFGGALTPAIANLTNVETLTISFNDFGRLKKRKCLRMSDCGLRNDNPKSIVNHSSIEFFRLGESNLVGGIPSGLFQLEALPHLYSYENQLSEPILDSFSNPSSLTYIVMLANNLLGGILMN